MTKEELNSVLESHLNWLEGTGGRQADLRSADLDLSWLPLSRRGLVWRIDRRLFCQFAYHLCSMQIEDEDCRAAQRALLPLAKEMHRTDVPRL